MNNWNSWAEEIMEMPAKERVLIAEEILSKLSEYGPQAEKLAEAIGDRNEFDYYAFNTHLHYVPYKERTPGSVDLCRWKKPHLIVKHKKLPLTIIVGDAYQRPFSAKQSIKSISKNSPVPQHLSWVEAVSRLSTQQKQILRDKIMDAIRSYRKNKNKNELWLSDFLEKSKEFTLKGFCVNCNYVRMDGDSDSIESLWIHPWGSQQLLFTHRDFPAMMIVGPTLRLNENLVGESDMVGFTG